MVKCKNSCFFPFFECFCLIYVVISSAENFTDFNFWQKYPIFTNFCLSLFIVKTYFSKNYRFSDKVKSCFFHIFFRKKHTFFITSCKRKLLFRIYSELVNRLLVFERSKKYATLLSTSERLLKSVKLSKIVEEYVKNY